MPRLRKRDRLRRVIDTASPAVVAVAAVASVAVAVGVALGVPAVLLAIIL